MIHALKKRYVIVMYREGREVQVFGTNTEMLAQETFKGWMEYIDLVMTARRTGHGLPGFDFNIHLYDQWRIPEKKRAKSWRKYKGRVRFYGTGITELRPTGEQMPLRGWSFEQYLGID